METKFDAEPETGVSSLISGIIQDSRQLLTQQLTLFQVELKNDLRRAIMACVPIRCLKSEVMLTRNCASLKLLWIHPIGEFP